MAQHLLLTCLHHTVQPHALGQLRLHLAHLGERHLELLTRGRVLFSHRLELVLDCQRTLPLHFRRPCRPPQRDARRELRALQPRCTA
jgi:hypothetical protein